MGVSKKKVPGHPKMDGENNGKPYFFMDDFGVSPYFWKHPYRCQPPTSWIFCSDLSTSDRLWDPLVASPCALPWDFPVRFGQIIPRPFPPAGWEFPPKWWW